MRVWDRLVPAETGSESGRLAVVAKPEAAPTVVATESTPRRWNLATFGAMAASALAMAFNLDSRGLTGDEAFTAQMVKLPWATMLADLGNIDYNMSLHYIALKAWTGVFGTSETSLRLPSVIFALAALMIGHRLLTRLFGLRKAVLATTLLALNPFFIEVAVTARPYAMLLLWASVATFALVRCLEEQTPTRWLWYGLAAVVGLHVHLLAILVVAAHVVFAITFQRGVNRYNLEAVGLILAFGVVPTALFLAPSNTLAWIGPFSLAKAAVVGLSVAGGGILGAAIAVLALAGLLWPPTEDRMKWLPAISLVIPVLICLALAPFQSLFVDLYFVVILAPLAVVAAFGLDWILKQKARLVIPAGLVLAVGGLALSLFTGGIGSQQGWRDLSQSMAGEVAPGDVVAFPNPYYRIVAEYYAIDPSAGPYPPGNPILPTAPWGSLRPYELDVLKRTDEQTSPEVVEAQIVGHERVWLVGLGDGINRAVRQQMEANGYRLVDVVTSVAGEAHLYVAG